MPTQDRRRLHVTQKEKKYKKNNYENKGTETQLLSFTK